MADAGFVLALSCGLLMLYSYLGYPLILKYLVSRKGRKNVPTDEAEPKFKVAVLMAVHNESTVLSEKLACLNAQDYPKGLFEVYIGSDASTDGTNEMLHNWAQEGEGRHILIAEERTGKPGLIAQLVLLARAAGGDGLPHIFIMTDASVMPDPNAVRLLVRHFNDPQIGLVDAHLIHTGMRQKGISRSENSYISSEVTLKHLEGLLWGTMMGPFGGFFAIRADLYQPVPSNFLVDDFFLCMKVLQSGASAISDLDSHCYESVSHRMEEEFRRKSRISAGNFQNLAHFKKLWWPPFTTLAFSFISHKIIRWLGGFWILGMLLGSFLMGIYGNNLEKGLFSSCLFVFFGLPLINALSKKFGVHWKVFTDLHYFLWMHLALLIGFLNYLYGIKSNVWKPTSREQDAT